MCLSFLFFFFFFFFFDEIDARRTCETIIECSASPGLSYGMRTFSSTLHPPARH